LQVALELFPSCYNCALRSASYDVGGRGRAPQRVEEKEEEEEVVMTTGSDMMVRYFSLA
jgi:hypothetical protein